MVTNLLIMPGDCCIGGVRHILSSFSVLGVISSPTRILSRLPSSTPFPNHRPQGNLKTRIAHYFPESCGQPTSQQVSVTQETCSLVSVPRNLVADQNALHQPLCVEPRVIMTHLYCRQLAQVLALREGEEKKEKRDAQRHQTPETRSIYIMRH